MSQVHMCDTCGDVQNQQYKLLLTYPTTDPKVPKEDQIERQTTFEFCSKKCLQTHIAENVPEKV
jgi:hypothetical protein